MFVCYLLHLSTAVLCFIDFSIALCNCSNARVRYDVTCWYSKGLFIWGKTPHLPGPVLRGEIPPSNKILCSFISRLHEEHNTTGIVKSHLTRGGISPRWGEIFPYKRNTTGMVRWIESIRWFSLVSSSWFHGRETLLHLTSQPRRWQVRWKISYKQWLKSTSPLSTGPGKWGVFPHINRPLEYQQVTSYRTLAFEQLHRAMLKSMKHNTAVERCNK